MSHLKPNQARRLVDMTDADLIEIVGSQLEAALADRPAANADPLMDRSEAAQFLRISLPQLDRLCRDGAIPFVRVGDSKRFERTALLEALKAKAVQS